MVTQNELCSKLGTFGLNFEHEGLRVVAITLLHSYQTANSKLPISTKVLASLLDHLGIMEFPVWFWFYIYAQKYQSGVQS